jgi:transcriptional regulator with XRE-family HTH domain
MRRAVVGCLARARGRHRMAETLCGAVSERIGPGPRSGRAIEAKPFENLPATRKGTRQWGSIRCRENMKEEPMNEKKNGVSFRAPHAALQIDRHVGARVRIRRIIRNMSQSDVAAHLDISYQQFQKYEAGINRISASKLQQIADILQVAPSFFFEELAQTNDGKASAPDWREMEFVTTTEGLAAAQAFSRIREPAIRRAIVTLVEKMAGVSTRSLAAN